MEGCKNGGAAVEGATLRQASSGLGGNWPMLGMQGLWHDQATWLKVIYP